MLEYINFTHHNSHSLYQVANMIKGKTPDEIRKTFNIKNDFTPAEEEQVWHAGYPVDIIY